MSINIPNKCFKRFQLRKEVTARPHVNFSDTPSTLTTNAISEKHVPGTYPTVFFMTVQSGASPYSQCFVDQVSGTP